MIGENSSRGRLPLHDSVGDRVGDIRDRPSRHLDSAGLLEMMADLARRHPAGVQADDHRVEPVHSPLALTDQAGSERPGSIAWHLDLEAGDLRIDRLHARPNCECCLERPMLARPSRTPDDPSTPLATPARRASLNNAGSRPSEPVSSTSPESTLANTSPKAPDDTNPSTTRQLNDPVSTLT